MSKETPRTDAVLSNAKVGADKDWDPWHLSRTLERELQAANERAAAAERNLRFVQATNAERKALHEYAESRLSAAMGQVATGLAALEAIAQLREETEMDYAAAYYAMFKGDGRAAWDQVSNAIRVLKGEGG
jgi:aminopeptidase N